MIDLLTRPPDDWQSTNAVGDAPAICFYFGVRAGESHMLPLGAHFGVVYSPNPYVNPESPLRPWHYSVFEVGLYQYRPGREVERSYSQIKRRQLTRFEVPHFEALWLDITIRGGKTHEPSLL